MITTKTIKTLIILVVFIAMSCTTPSNTPSNTNTEPETIAGSMSYEDKTGSVGTTFSLASSNKNIVPSTATVKYSIDPTLPQGFTFDSNTGDIGGIPMSASVSTGYVVTATGTDDYTGSVDSNPFTISIDPESPTLTDISSASSIRHANIEGIVGRYLVASLESTIVPSTATVRYSIDPPLPLGFILDSNTGDIGGIPISASVSTSHVVTATGTDDYTGSVDSNPFTISIDPESPTPKDISSASSIRHANIEGIVGRYLVASLESTIVPSTATVTYSLAPTTLPEGVTFDSVTGVISGTPREAFDSTTDSTTGYVVTATGTVDYTGSVDSDPFTIGIEPESPTLTDISSASSIRHANIEGIVGRYLVASLESTIVPSTATVRYSIDPPLPLGFILDSNTGDIGGIPISESASTSHVITATGTGDYTGSIDSDPFTITVAVAVAKLPITGTVTYASSVSDTGEIVELSPTSTILPANATVRYTVTPDLPEGWALASDTGLISSGGPADATALETYSVTATGTGDYTGSIDSDPFTITVNGISITEYTISYFDIGLSLGSSLPSIFRIPKSTIPAEATVEYSLAPAIVPDGTAFDSVTGEFSGTPTEVFDSTATPYSVTVTGTGNYTGTIVSDPFTLRVYKIPIGGTIHYESVWYDIGEDVSLFPTSPSLIGVDVAYSVTMGSLPDGLRLDTPSGRIFGNPAGEASANLQITANGIGNYEGVVVSNEFSITISNRIEIGGSFSYPSSTTVLVGDPANISISQNDLTPSDATIRYEEHGDFLPAGLSVNPDTGAVEVSSGETTTETIAEGTYTGQIRAVGSRLYKGTIQSNEFTIEITRVEIGGSFSYPSSTTVLIGNPVNVSISQNDLTPSDATIRYEEHDDFLPAGLSVHPDTGAVEESSGETTTETIAEGTYTGQVRAVGTGAYKGTIQSNEFTIEITRVEIGGSFSYPSSTTVFTHPRAASDPVNISISQNDLTPSEAMIRYEEHDDFLPAGLSVHPDTGVIEETTTETIAEGTYTGQIRAVGTGVYKGTIHSDEFTIEINDRIPLTGTIDYTYFPYRCATAGAPGAPPEDCIDNLVTFNFEDPPNIYPVIATGTVLEAQRNGGLRYITRYYNPSTREFEVWRAFWGLTDPASFTFFSEDTGAFSKDPNFLHARFLAYRKPFPVYTFRVTAIGIGAYTGTVSRVINIEMLFTREFERP